MAEKKEGEETTLSPEMAALNAQFEDVQKKTAGFVEGDKEPEKKEEEKPDDKKGDDEPEPKKPEPPEKKEEDAGDDIDDDEPDDKKGEDDDEEDDDVALIGTDGLPKKHIPIKLFQDKKKKWNETAAQKDARIAELEGLLKAKPGSKEQDEKINAYAEKYGMEPEGVAELKQILLDDLLGNEDIKAIQKAAEGARESAEIQHFEKEFTAATPALKEKYPNATDKQLAEAKKLLDDLSHSEWGHTKELDYIIYKKGDELAKIFKEPAKGTKTAETGRIGNSRPTTLTAADFKGKKDFAELLKLPDDQKNAIVKDLAPDDFWNYGRYLDSVGTGIEVRRGGNRVSLKS